jgi:hypothetical protein
MILYDMPEEQYHADPSLGQSTAKLAVKSLQLVKDKIDGIYVPSQSTEMGIGSIVHRMVLQPGSIQTADQGPINDRTGKPYGRDTIAFAAWQNINPGLIVIDPWMRTMLDRMPEEAGDIFQDGKTEVSVFHEDRSRVRVKARMDHVSDMLMITDLKTCNDCSEHSIERDAAKYLYWFQSAFYRRMMLQETSESYRFQFVFCEKKPPYRWRVVCMTADYNLWANSQVQHVLDRIARAQESGNWNDDNGIDVMVGMPQYMTDDEDEDGAE